MNRPIKNWQNVIWREWRHCDDEEYAHELFELVADEPAGWNAAVALVLIGALYFGLMGGLLTGILATNWDVLDSPEKWRLVWTEILPFVWKGMGIGGAAAGLLAWVWAGRRLAWRAWLACLTPQVRRADLVGGLVGGLGVGLSVGLGGLGVGLESLRYVHEYRSWWLWWRARPRALDVEAALRHAASVGIAERFAPLLPRLDGERRSPRAAEQLINALAGGDWQERFVARHALVARGGEVVERLRGIAQDRNSPRRRTAIWLIESIAQETTQRWERRAPRLLCLRCLARCGAHQVRLSWRNSVTYYGCRACHQSREFLDRSGEVVAVLDAAMSDERLERNGVLRVNYLARNAVFDFDRVEIAQATDAEVERFAVQVGNDTDEFRRPRYRRMTCTVSAECRLSENTMRILRSMFGEVVVKRET